MHNGAVHVAKWEPGSEQRNEPKRDARTMIMILAMGVLMLHIMTRMWVDVMMIMMTARTMMAIVAVTNIPNVSVTLMI